MIKFCSFLCVTVLFVNHIFAVNIKRYEFNDNNILIEPIRSLGLRISIPNIDKNIKRFSFHGNVEDEIDVAENGTLNKSCFMVINGRWTIIFEDILIYKNDIINYWFEVEINDSVYRYRNRNFKVTNLIYLSTSEITPFTTNCNSSESANESINSNPSDLQDYNLEPSFKKRFESVAKDVEILKKLFNDNIKKPTNTKLILIRLQPSLSTIINATNEIQHFLTDQLQYYSSELKKLNQANNTECGIVFDMNSNIDKEIILLRSLEFLNTTNYKLVDYENYYCNQSSINRKLSIINSTEKSDAIQIYFPQQ